MVYEILADRNGSKIEQVFECQEAAFRLYKDLTNMGYSVQWTCFSHYDTIEAYSQEKLKLLKEELERFYN